jgi:ribosome-associated translation inhibitor RaiA
MMGSPEIRFRDFHPSAQLAADVREDAEKLSQFYDRIQSCRVTVEAPHRHQTKGKRFHVRIHIAVPDETIDVARDADEDPGHQDIRAALRDAFDAARKQLQEYAAQRRGDGKGREALP